MYTTNAMERVVVNGPIKPFQIDNGISKYKSKPIINAVNVEDVDEMYF